MKKVLLILFVISCNIVLSQEGENSTTKTQEVKKDIKKMKQEDVQTTKYVFGVSQMDLSEFSTYLGVGDYNKNLYYWGFGDSHHFGRFYYDGGFSFYLNQKQAMSDTSRTRLNGFAYYIHFGYDLLKNKKLNVFPMVGFGYQHMMLQVEQDVFKSPYAGIEKVKYMLYNPSFIVDFGLEIRVPLYKESVSFSLKGGYKLDLSDKKWKYDDDKLNVKSDLSGTYAQFSLILND
jgi:hypothetical protein